ncbi:MAG: NAD-dependent epimerase/dehydratase family protein [Bdellovibrionota bacterium]
MPNRKIILAGGAGLVGLNLLLELKQRGFDNIIVLDKHAANIEIARSVFPNVEFINADLSVAGLWQLTLKEARCVVMLQAQIGDLTSEAFERNNVVSTQRVIESCKQHHVPYIVHVSSSVVHSVANDDYTNTKRRQEMLVQESGIHHVILRPTLMFGWFDRKHLGWLARMMKKFPLFPIAGHGKYMRQPLYVRDFCRIIVSCIQKETSGMFNITGFEKIDYIDMIRDIKHATGSKSWIVKVPYSLFFCLLKVWSWVDRDPPFTTDQLRALVACDEFEVIDWPTLFNVKNTVWKNALQETFNDARYSNVELDF